MKLVYICSPNHGDYETNRKNAFQYCKNALDLGVVAFAPHLYFAPFFEDAIPEWRAAALKAGLQMLEKADELWVMGAVHSEGMLGEITCAKEQNIPVYYVSEPLDLSTYPVSADKNSLLTEADCEERSRAAPYEGKLVVLSHENLKPECRTPRNQIWHVTHGPGSRPGCKFSDTVHLCHPADHDTLAVSRGKILGIVKLEVLEKLTVLYPELCYGNREEEVWEPEELNL